MPTSDTLEDLCVALQADRAAPFPRRGQFSPTEMAGDRRPALQAEVFMDWLDDIARRAIDRRLQSGLPPA